MKILGIDPGSHVTGYGIIEYRMKRVSHVESGTIRGQQKEYCSSLPEIFCAIEKIIERHNPNVVAVEDIFFASNARSALRLGHTRGVILLAIFRSGVPLYEYSALEVKKAVTGYGRADKTQVQKMIIQLLDLAQTPPALDASDALAVAICHAHSEKMHAKTQEKR